ncbi:rod shape-determining protein MreD [Novisyntrophococcus fermenticellae]|uniref:rod shape-determining protein MreD n=1 Tax=Novisyntrophococcus fermenticellae TaxID=2068655 RepID=UPI001E4D4EA3|nr:rod shape-determining protein MreD [Novisyntrophococcus fermenticellae]
MRRKLIIALLIILTFIIQTTIFKTLTVASVAPNLLLILTVTFGFMRGKKSGIWIGFFCGLCIDLLYSGTVGMNALIYMYIGYLNGFLYKVFYDEDIKVPVILIGLSDFVYCVITYILQFLMRVRLDFMGYFQHIIIPEMVYTIVISIIIYRPLYKLNKKLVENEMEGQELPWLKR